MSAENLALWHSVEATDPKHTKKITGKQYGGTSPKPHWLVMRATETFGPCGIGWGFTVEERVEKGAMIAPEFYEQMHVAKVKVWYLWEGARGEVEHIGGTMFSGKRASGNLYTDEDAPKKSVTDALVKALSMIGFAGDIFMGRFDDSKYVAEVADQFDDDKGPSMTDLLNAAERRLREATKGGASELEKCWRALDADLKPALKAMLTNELLPEAKKIAA